MSGGGGISAALADNIDITNNTIENNLCNSITEQAGGAGINLLRCGKSYITNNEINENILTAGTNAWGGGILLDKAISTSYINNNKINNNTSEGIGMGGGISIYNDNDTASYFINSNMTMNNYSDNRGGGLFARNTYNMYMVNNLFKGNESDYSGGAVMFFKSAKELWRDDNYPVIANNTFINNTSTNGGAIYNGYFDKVAIIFNSIFCDNSANTGRDLYNASTLDMIVYNNVLDTSMINTPWIGVDNIFCDPELQSDSLHLDLASLCVNAGIESLTFEDNTYYCPDQDIDGDERPFEWTEPDIGADEALWHYVLVDESISSANLLVSVFPNPFTVSITIEYELKQPEKTSICIYNHLGQIVYQTQENQAQGKQQIIWNAERYTEGVYYYRLKVGDTVANGKMVKVR